MTVTEAYRQVLDRLNKWSSNDGQHVSERVFVNAYNKVQYHWFTDNIKKKDKTQIEQEAIQQFLKNVCINPKKDKISLLIDLPKDYYYYSRIYGKCSNGDCEHDVYAIAREEGNVNRLLQDAFHKPSFTWQETFFTLGNNQIRFYTDGFNCSEIVLVYYRCPKEINMKVLGSDIHPELTKDDLQEVLDRVVQLLSEDIQDPRYQTITRRIQQNEGK